MSTQAGNHGTGLDGPLTEALVSTRKFFSKAQVSPDGRTMEKIGGRSGDSFYRDRWSHDKVVRSTHGVNCTGSCSWKVYVKDGIITWEAQQTDYPSTGADRPEYEPRGCPRGAAFSWYTYSPTRVRYPYVRGVLLDMYRAAKKQYGDPVLAWASIMQDPEKVLAYKSARGKGGLVRASWAEAVEIVAAANVYTIKRWGPDRIAGFSPIPAMSMVSYASGARFTELIGGAMLSFYDWYADLPMASPQMFGDQTDVPEAGDWWDAGYLIMWGSNVPLTRTPDAHWMTEARYRGQKVVVMSPDYAENVKFADEWLAVAPGTDAALAMAMGHVILKEFFVDKPVEFFTDYCTTYTDLPFLVALEKNDEGAYVPGKFIVAGDLSDVLPEQASSENAMWKPALIDAVTDQVVIPHGTLGDRFGEEGMGKWNLDLGETRPRLSLHGAPDVEAVEVRLPRFDALDGKVADLPRGVPARQVGSRLVTTVFDLMLAQYGVAREGLPGTWPTGYEDAEAPYTPAWQEDITTVPAAAVARIAREFAQNAVDSHGRSMILMGAGTNHWYHSDLIYRAMLVLTTITGCQGRNGGGWAHYVGQEKIRPLSGFQHTAFSLDWHRPPRHMAQTAYWYMHTSQYRYDTYSAADVTAGLDDFGGRTVADLVAQSARSGWLPSYPTLNRNPLTLCDEAQAAGMEPKDYVVDQLKKGDLRFAAEDPDAEENWPRVLMMWRANLFGSSAKGDEYFLRHLLGTDHGVNAEEASPDQRPKEVVWREQAPEGKLDLLMTIDFRMTSSTILSDVVLPAATWYEKNDINTTDMHPFIHSFNPAIAPPWQSKTDWDAFVEISKVFSELAADHLGVRKDLVAKPLWHDTPEAMADVHGVVKDWKAGECEPIPGKTMPVLAVVERDYSQTYAKMTSVGPLFEKLGNTTKGITYDVRREVDYLRHKNGVVRGGIAEGQPRLDSSVNVAETIMALSGTTNGHFATQGFKTQEKRCGNVMHDLAAENEGKMITFADTVNAPVPVITSPEWSGSETGGRRYSPFTINIERLKPFHTLTGRMQFYVDHDWMQKMGEGLPTYRPPLNMTQLFGERALGEVDQEGGQGVAVSVRYLTPHNKWSIHSEYQDNLFMLSLGRGGQSIWMSDKDADKIGIRDNDWIEAVNRNGVVAARAVVTHRMPEGTVYMPHAQDRLIDVPLTEHNGRRGGIHNSMTRIMVKPTHIIGGYAQLAYFFNYIGPTGNNRDEVTMIRKRSQNVQY
ncbi:respiratory nitrate reductase alpha subunit apoprotein [Austwickia chelonae]|uniref:Nitrate reductase alpha subunit n=1 Tax=Austwickia chelonae NBRC 105200 TaxID=1184607 RepID=K6UN62_9MICO|nr:nitrate reductase subunit alpha [Austwickia chelonae]GAB78716.1 nitrate reductase alpha subunit [Austwickia chelonae NBRC 105200]SEW34982.1 respiratory nitrate reductase alpha subunit apoprotein [Austwickia chelonae]